jgi:peptidoglycan biosynthesis protein MviN/MurJ (putative lipid II flippase)
MMSAAMGAAVYAVAWFTEAHLVDIHTKTGQIIQVGSAIAAGGLVYFGLSFLLKMEETGMVRDMLRRKRRRSA